MITVKVLEHWYTESLEDVERIENTGCHLGKVTDHITPPDRRSPGMQNG